MTFDDFVLTPFLEHSWVWGLHMVQIWSRLMQQMQFDWHYTMLPEYKPLGAPPGKLPVHK